MIIQALAGWCPTCERGEMVAVTQPSPDIMCDCGETRTMMLLVLKEEKNGKDD